MALNATGAYAFQAGAHIGHTVEDAMAIVDARITIQQAGAADQGRRIARKTRSATRPISPPSVCGPSKPLSKSTRRRRAAGSKRSLGRRNTWATALGTGDQDLLRWFILIVASSLYPVALLLLAAA
jgi:hypothetical protein